MVGGVPGEGAVIAVNAEANLAFGDVPSGELLPLPVVLAPVLVVVPCLGCLVLLVGSLFDAEFPFTARAELALAREASTPIAFLAAADLKLSPTTRPLASEDPEVRRSRCQFAAARCLEALSVVSSWPVAAISNARQAVNHLAKAPVLALISPSVVLLSAADPLWPFPLPISPSILPVRALPCVLRGAERGATAVLTTVPAAAPLVRVVVALASAPFLTAVPRC